MLGPVASREDIRAMLRAIHPGSAVVDFVVDVLMPDGEAFFPAAQLADGRPGHFVAIARLAATELRIAEASLNGRLPPWDDRDRVRQMTTQFLWTRLVKLRGRAQEMARDFDLLHVPPRTAPVATSHPKRSPVPASLASLLRARAAA